MNHVKLNVELSPKDGRIVDIGPCRHRVIWSGDDKESLITYCNHCGSGVVFGPEFGPDFCSCGAPAE